ncbi:hypothetical protein PPACK8108_LOCUS24051 [Phakopsora pachyrhizi]|uniref:Uncharacterized protein n=1 Tax=Phakopsora pachyrhizi TaxID=170000 RepID=A0AAV0BQP8_PHAPC|nr:hypothetical protein PPACK8108_LOCUS24051 [Phakopsora pachyrhizi]
MLKHSKKEQDQDQRSNVGVKTSGVKPTDQKMTLYQSPFLKDSFSEYATSSIKKYISMFEDLRKEHEKASKLKQKAAERLKVLRSFKKEAEDELFDLLNRKTSMSRITSVAGSPFPTRIPSVCSSIKPRTIHKELMKYIPQHLQIGVEKIDNPPKDGDCGGISIAEFIRKHLSAELKKDKKMYEMIEGRNIDEEIRNTQAGKSILRWVFISS